MYDKPSKEQREKQQVDQLIAVEDRFQNPHELLVALSPSNNRFIAEGHKWIFRGQLDGPRENEEGELIPSAHRIIDKLKSFSFVEIDKIGVRTYADQLQAEYRLVMDFAYSATKRGLSLPGLDLLVFDTEGEEILLSRIEAVVEGRDSQWPISNLLCATAIAQHYGIPTCMLDWTESGRTALYFSASNSIEPQRASSSSKFVVWALNVEAIREIYIDDTAYFANRIRVIDAPRSICPTLAAQQGMFTILEYGLDAEDVFKPIPFEMGIRRRIEQIVEKNEHDKYPILYTEIESRRPILTKYIMNKEYAGETMRLLAHEGVSPATLFPGYGGITKSIKEQENWDHRQPSFRWNPRTRWS